MERRKWILLLAAIVLFTAARVMTTHRVFSATVDEPIHVAAGYDLLTRGSYALDPEHPPLARVLFALPFVDTPDPNTAEPFVRGNALLFRNDRYTQNIARARLGNLLFLALGIVGVALWGRRLFSPAVGLVAALLYASLPPVLAHAGLATTDMAGAAMFTIALYALACFLDAPTWPRTLLLALAIGAGLLSKFSFVVYFPAAAVIVVLVRRRFPIVRLFVAGVLAFLVLWAGYRFSIGTPQDADARASEFAQKVFGSPAIAQMRVPAPHYVVGMIVLKKHDVSGHDAYLFGEKRKFGWWYYFPLALFYKTPIPFLLLVIAGCALLIRRRAEVVLIALSVLGVAMTSHINIGVRHILPIYAPLAIAAALAIVELRRLRIVTLALAGWMFVSVAAAHPDYLPWFNIAAGAHPEEVLNDSNLDWGQDVLRLVRTAREMHIPQMTVSLFTTADLERIGLPPHRIAEAGTQIHGWLAVSEMNIVVGRNYDPRVRRWVDELIGGRPYRRIGKSIRLYQLP